MEFAAQTVELFKMLVAAILMLSSVVGALFFLASKTKFLMRLRIKRRLATCPTKAVCDLRAAQEEKRIDCIKNTLNDTRSDLLQMQGVQIASYCSFAIQRGYFPLYEKVLVQDQMDDYEKKGGNHGVRAIFDIAMKLPPDPNMNRRCTDTQI